MRKYIALVGLVMAISTLAMAQLPKSERLRATDTLNNAATVYLSFNGVGSKLKSIQVAATKVSGTVAGTVWIQGTVDGTNWVSVTDTLTLANQALNTKTWIFTATNYNSYRASFTGSGTLKAAISVALLRRADE